MSMCRINLDSLYTSDLFTPQIDAEMTYLFDHYLLGFGDRAQTKKSECDRTRNPTKTSITDAMFELILSIFLSHDSKYALGELDTPR